jgi:hypothetical protein
VVPILVLSSAISSASLCYCVQTILTVVSAPRL